MGLAHAAADTEKGFDKEQEAGSATHSCSNSKKTKKYWVEVWVKTRLGEIPVRGVKVTVAGENWDKTDKQGGFLSGGKTRRKQHGESTLEISGAYENPDEKMKAEEFRIKLCKLDPATGAKDGEVYQRIRKIQDVAGTRRDVDFERRYPVEKLEKEFEWLTGDASTSNEPILRVTVKLATFSLYVRYLNQNLKNDAIVTRPGSGKDPEKNSHKARNDQDGEVEWPGHSLCSPTSATMLADYWTRLSGGAGSLDRAAIMQKYYDIWSEESFKDRYDKAYLVKSRDDPRTEDVQVQDGLAMNAPAAPYYPPAGRLVMQDAPPPAPVDGAYWLCSLEEPYQLWKAHYTYSWQEIDASSLAMTLHPGPPPDSPEAGDLWVPAASPPRVFQWTAIEYKWKKIPQGWWRVTLRKYSSAPVWQFHARTATVVASFAPKGAEARSGISSAIEGRAPLSRVLPGETEEVVVGEGKKKKVKVVPLDPSPLEDYKQWLASGWPFIVGTNATDYGHVILVRGAIVDEEGQIHWLLCNDPYGNLSSEGTLSIDFDITNSVGRNLDNLPADVKAVQSALHAAGHWKGESDGVCSGEEEHPLVQAITTYQKDVLKLKGKGIDGKASPGGGVAKKLGLTLSTTVGVSSDTRIAANDPADVAKVQQVLEALRYYAAADAEGECTDALVTGIEAFQRTEVKMKQPDGFIGNGSPTEKALQKAAAGGGYSGEKKEKEKNKEHTNEGDGTRGKHVYYRNSTPGHKHVFRIGPFSCARAELKLEADVIAAQLVPGK